MSRLERDSLGEIHVPDGALYGAQTQRALQNFAISPLKMPRQFIQALGYVKWAAAQVNGDLKIIDRAMADAIGDAALEVAAGEHDAHFPVDVFQTGSGTSTNMNANEVIAQLASDSLGQKVHANNHVNAGQSSNDVIPTCIHLSAALATEQHLLPALTALTECIRTKAQPYFDVAKTGRTHLMDAMPLTVAQEWSAWVEQLLLSKERIESTLPRLHRLAIGATAVGTGVNTHKEFGERVCELLSGHCKLSFSPKINYFEALSSQDTALELSGQLKTLAAALMKISNDLRWMNSRPLTGFAEVSLPALQPGSSIMPGKVNPVIPEAVAMACAQVIGADATITVAAQSGNFQLNVMLPVIAYNLLHSIELLSQSLVHLNDKVFDGIEINADTLAANLARNPILVTALNPIIGYEKSAEIAKKAYRENRAIIDVALECTSLTRDELEVLLDPKTLCQPNIV